MSDSKSNMTPAEKLFNNFVGVLNSTMAPGPDGEPTNPGAPTLSVIRQFIKDQNISADPDTHEGLRQVSERSRKLPFDEKPWGQ